ncbi:MAG TPA: sigma-70 family RNA polymerase sigma factor [Candidatus Elarobacter sp.]|nr:sigma-70 family RNA polymerase sigma factor [Candidatus Elarobacter sp.]
MSTSAADAAERVAASFRADGGRTLATLSRAVGDIALAEDALQDAYLAALQRWPRDGFPARPSAWILATARNRAIDRLRRERVGREKLQRLAALEPAPAASRDADDSGAGENAVPDDRLGLIFACCHPALGIEARIALTLRTLAGLTVEEIADAFLVPHATMAQRLVRVKRKIRESAIPFEVPPAERLAERLADVCAVVYLIFNEGYAASSGAQLVRRDLCDEAIRLARVLLALVPDEREVMSLLALMLYHDSRRDARVREDGTLVALPDQDRSTWNRAKIDEATALLARANGLGAPGAYQIQAMIAFAHASAASAGDVDWHGIAELYGHLDRMAPSPVVALNRAVAIGFADGPLAGLAALDALPREALESYHLYHVARADVLARLERSTEARAAYRAALALTQNAAEQAYLRAKLRETA